MTTNEFFRLHPNAKWVIQEALAAAVDEPVASDLRAERRGDWLEVFERRTNRRLIAVSVEALTNGVLENASR